MRRALAALLVGFARVAAWALHLPEHDPWDVADD